MQTRQLLCAHAARRRAHHAAVQLLSNPHYLLVTLVLWNAASMEALPIFLDRLIDPVTAIILSVTAVLFFGAHHLSHTGMEQTLRRLLCWWSAVSAACSTVRCRTAAPQ